MSEKTTDNVEGGHADVLGLETGENPSLAGMTEDKGRIEVGDVEAENDVKDHLQVDAEPQEKVSPSTSTSPLNLLSSHPADSLHAPDSPTTSLISSLRDQLALLSDQSIALNQKLISSIGKSSDLEDELHELQNSHLTLNKKADELEREKNRWEESMNTGLLVERSQIKDEMQRLAAGLVEEERKRGSAEKMKEQVENEVDDLTAKLFDQANAMVATERMSRAEAEARLKSTEENLAAAEAAVRDMQLHLQSLPSNSTQQSSSSSLPAHTNGDSTSSGVGLVKRKYLSSHIPYTEFISFITHLRTLRPIKDISKNTFQPPLITNLLTQSFLVRTINEDNDTTLRLDIAPDLSWLSRRSVSQAIISGELIIEPVSTSTLLSNPNTSISNIHDLNCSLCGKSIFGSSLLALSQSPLSPLSGSTGNHFGPPPIHPQRGTNTSSNTTTTSRFSLKPFFNSSSSSSNINTSSSASTSNWNQTHQHGSSPIQSPMSSPALHSGSGNISSVYIFRIAKPQAGEKSDSKLYPLCRTGWCLERMRATCELWHFVRTGIIHVIWHGDDGNTNTPTPVVHEIYAPPSDQTIASTSTATTGTGASTSTPTETETKISAPPLPQRKKSSWALGFKLSDKSAGSWTRGWKSGSETTTNGNDNQPSSPDLGERRRSSVGSLGAEKAIDNRNGTGELEDPIQIITENKNNNDDSHTEKVPIIVQEPISTIVTSESEDPKAGNQQGEKPNSPNEYSGLQAEPLSRATSNTTTTTDDAGAFSTPKGGQNDLPSSDDDADVDGQDEHEDHGDVTISRDEQSTPHPPQIDTSVTKRSSVIDVSSPKSGIASASPTKPPPPIPRRAAARDRLTQLGGNSPASLVNSPVNSQPTSPARRNSTENNDDEDEDEDGLAALRELRHELEQRKGDDALPETQTSTKEEEDKADEIADREGVAEGAPAKRPVEDFVNEKEKKEKEEEELEEPFTPVNLDEKFPPSPIGTFPSSISSRPNSQSIHPLPPPPALPPRTNPKTPILQNSTHTPSMTTEGEKRFLSTNENGESISWEGKTWEKIVRLKEQMWKARIGVIDQ
ncbi:uncharacterized protein IL334_001695 [Kwoniella shivajii]|uniref:GDP/GTP exchange factor Sec2 N-terminal domain-containing protein n=1 Tax=Kwoniella shivajii TaxID=564305 RepID=A0ABZ1CVQ7_9TREE|nr:hypothetical protein IL334_001695 [Kwoniella shivajii]